MDDERFDGLIRALGSGATRRGVLGVLAGLTGFGLSEVAAKRRKRGSRKRKGRVQAQAQADKVTICHHDQEEDTWHPITISGNAVAQHKANHGDFEYDVEAGQCCTDTDCGEDGECTITVDDEGTGSGSCGCTAGVSCGNFQTCEDDPNCGCVVTTEGDNACVRNTCAGGCASCSSSSTCPDGQRCIPNTCRGTVCIVPCSANQAAARSASSEDGRRPLDSATD